jgi:deazaflavin-dependent oxidoreductase (nitroreductase family)
MQIPRKNRRYNGSVFRVQESHMTQPNDFNQKLMEDFRANAGHVSSGPFVGRPVLIITTTGARSGQQRETPLVFGEDGANLFVIASKGGAPTHPAWFHNISANPEVTLEVGAQKYRARARVAGSAERDRLYNMQAAAMPAFADYEQKTTRKIPVVVLERID